MSERPELIWPKGTRALLRFALFRHKSHHKPTHIDAMFEVERGLGLVKLETQIDLDFLGDARQVGWVCHDRLHDSKYIQDWEGDLGRNLGTLTRLDQGVYSIIHTETHPIIYIDGDRWEGLYHVYREGNLLQWIPV